MVHRPRECCPSRVSCLESASSRPFYFLRICTIHISHVIRESNSKAAVKQAIPEGQTCPAATCDYALNALVFSRWGFFKAGVPCDTEHWRDPRLRRVDSSGPIVGPYKQKPRSLEQDLAAVLRFETHGLQLRVSLLIVGLAPAILLLL